MTKEISLTQGQVALVDDEDYDFLNQWKWCATRVDKNFYAMRSKGKGLTFIRYSMHRVIMNTPKELIVDHINRNGLDNRKENLRNCNTAQNQHNAGPRRNNTTGFKGVIYLKRERRYEARLRIGDKIVYMPLRLTPERAFEDYKEACRKYHGEFVAKECLE